jgi:hypothetical protein
MSYSFPLRITSDAFEALSPEAQAEILAVLEPHESRSPSAAAAGGGAAAGPPPRTPPSAVYPPAWAAMAPGAPARPALRRRHKGCGLHDGLYDEAGQRCLGPSVEAGGIQLVCQCRSPPARPPPLDLSGCQAALGGGAADLSEAILARLRQLRNCGPAEADELENVLEDALGADLDDCLLYSEMRAHLRQIRVRRRLDFSDAQE